jgi:hypothetical protein
MDGSAHFGILWHENTGFYAKTGRRMKNSRGFFILWQENEPEEPKKISPVRQQEILMVSCCRARISSWTEAYPAAVGRSLSPARIASSAERLAISG